MNQLSIDFSAAREHGRLAADACAAKAERVAEFDSAGAAKFVRGELLRHGPMSGEALTDSAISAGFRPHDARAYGGVFASLARKGVIRCVGYCERLKGHGTAGGRIWEAVA